MSDRTPSSAALLSLPARARGAAFTRSLGALTRVNWDRISLLASVLFGAVFGIGQVVGRVQLPFDFEFYWRATDFSNLYADTWLDPYYAYVYPPPLAQVFAPLHLLPFEVALVLWITVCFVSLWVCVREWTLLVITAGLVATLLPPGHVLGAGLTAVLLGNVQMPMTAAIVSAGRWPALWVIALVTKVTPGIGVLVHLFRREWRPFAAALGATAVVVAMSFALAPSAWSEYVRWTIANYGGPSNPPIVGPPLPLRLVAALVIVAWAARTGRSWPLAIASGIAVPAIYGWTTVVSVSLGAIGLARWDASRHGHATGARQAKR